MKLDNSISFYSNDEIYECYVSDSVEVFKNRFGTELYDTYSWVVSYFWTVYQKDYDEHGNSTSAFENASRWLSDQFNPFVVENMPPMVCLFKVRWEVEYSFSLEPVKVFAVVHLILKDVGGIYNITIRSLDTAKVFWVNTSGHNMVYDITHRFKVSVFTATFGSVRINVTSWDAAGNTLMIQKKLKGALEQVLDALAKLWSAIWDALCKVAEAVASAVNVIWNWIMTLINDLMAKITEPLKSTIDRFIAFMSGIAKSIYDIFNGTGDNSVWSRLEEIFTNPLFQVLSTLPILIISIYTIVSIASMGIGAIIMDLVTGMIIDLIITALVQGLAMLNINIPILTGTLIDIPFLLFSLILPSDQEDLGIARESVNIEGNESAIETIDLAVGVMGLFGSILGVFITWAIFKKSMSVLREARLLAERIKAIMMELAYGWYGRFISLEEYAGLLMIVRDDLIEMFGVLRTFTWEDIQTGFASYQKKLYFITYLSIGFGALSIIFSILTLTVYSNNHIIAAFIAGLSWGVSIYTFYQTLANKLPLKSGPTKMLESLGIVMNIIAALSSAWSMGYHLAMSRAQSTQSQG